MKFTAQVKDRIKYYVYAYSDPDTKEIFYIGNGKDNRAFDHLKERSDSEKVRKIQEIEDRGKVPVIELLRHGMDKSEALIAEAVAIDLLGVQHLTNKQKGHYSKDIGRMSIDEVTRIYDAKLLKEGDIIEKFILIQINQSYRPGMIARELYEATRRSWGVNYDRASQVEYAAAIYEGVIIEVYKVQQWFHAGLIFSERQCGSNSLYEFVGNIAQSSLRDKYVGKSVSDIYSAQKEFKYINA